METLRVALGIAGATVSTYATAWSIRRRREDRRWWIWLLVSMACWGYALWSVLR
ncbi:MAG TPA: hypothetical protein VFS05_14585 [Gemmatimonadaceae bacterium]|nr:hypothetical protein [Gemmatimonadaceae bacterium]